MNILITGGASNIGFQVASKLSCNNYVYLTVHTMEQYNNLQNRLNNRNMECLKLDITKDLDKLDNMDIDCLISFAGIGIGGSVLGMDIKYLRDNFDTNFFANIELIKKVYEKMLKKNRGKIFVTSSLANFMPLPMLGNYCASKAALSTLVTSIHQELKIMESSISISLIEPGAYYTGFNQVMIDNKEKYLSKDSLFYMYQDRFTKIQRMIFKLIEKKKIDGIVNKIVKEVLKDKPRFRIRRPLLQVIGIKLYLLIFR